MDQKQFAIPNPNDRQPPKGWPVGSFHTYTEAQAAVDHLSDEKFPVEKLTIVGVDLMEVEKVTGRLTWGKVLGLGAGSGAWFGLFFGLLLALYSDNAWGAMIWGVIMGALFGVIAAAVSYAFTQGQRDFSSNTQIVANRYDVLCDPDQAPAARDAIAKMGAGFHPEQDK